MKGEIAMLENYYEDAKETLAKALAPNSVLSITSFNSDLANQLVITSCSIDKWGGVENDRANMELVLNCVGYDFRSEDGVGTRVNHTLRFVVLCSEGDNRWTYNMKNSVWRGYYPSAIAIDEDSGEVYLLFNSNWGVELKHFNSVPTTFLKEFMYTRDENAPYYIYIDSRAMFDVLDGAEGYNHLLRNLYIQFQGTAPYRLHIRGSIADEEMLEANAEAAGGISDTPIDMSDVEALAEAGEDTPIFGVD